MPDNLWIAGMLLTIAVTCYFFGYLHGYHNGIKFLIKESVRLDWLIEYVWETFRQGWSRHEIDLAIHSETIER